MPPSLAEDRGLARETSPNADRRENGGALKPVAAHHHLTVEQLLAKLGL